MIHLNPIIAEKSEKSRKRKRSDSFSSSSSNSSSSSDSDGNMPDKAEICTFLRIKSAFVKIISS